MTRLWIVVVAVILVVSPGVWANPRHVIDPQSAVEGERLRAMISDAGDFRVNDATPQGFALGLSDAEGRTLGVLRLYRGLTDNVPRFHSRSYSMEVESYSPDPRITEQLVRAAGIVAARDGGGGENRHVQIPVPDLDALRGVALAFLALAVVVGTLRGGDIRWELRLPHLLPAAIQVIILAYWSLYWPGIHGQLPSIGMQLAMAFAADAAFSFARFGSWRVGASPLPVVLSMNLFVWLDPHGIEISILAAFASKTMLRRDGHHILNPSAFGLTVAGAISYLFPGFIHVGGLFHTMNLAPNIAELILLLALLPQSRFRILPLSIAALMALRMSDNPATLRPPIILAIALLATDPSTIPRTDIGKVLFGLTVGFGLVATSWELRHLGQTDDFAKVMPIPVANLLVPTFDWIAVTVTTTLRRAAAPVWRTLQEVPGAVRARMLVLRPIPNLALVVLWLMLTVGRLGDEKPHSFEPSLYWNLGTPLIVRDADDVPRCENNPVFCQPFSFIQELSLWRHPRRPTAPHVPSAPAPPSPSQNPTVATGPTPPTP